MAQRLLYFFFTPFQECQLASAPPLIESMTQTCVLIGDLVLVFFFFVVQIKGHKSLGMYSETESNPGNTQVRLVSIPAASTLSV